MPPTSIHEAKSEEMVWPELTASALKGRFKAKCGAIGNRHRNWQVRVHRSLSWLKRAEEFPEEQGEAKYLFLWIALNSLYGAWDDEKNAPAMDSPARDAFFRKICEWDKEMFAHGLKESRGLAKKVLENPYLAAVFWKQPDDPRAKTWAAVEANHLDEHLRNGQISRVMIEVMQRLFILRGQLVHGASSRGSRLNRGSLKYCLWLLVKFVPRIVHVVIEKGCHDDWPELCYPPVG